MCPDTQPCNLGASLALGLFRPKHLTSFSVCVEEMGTAAGVLEKGLLAYSLGTPWRKKVWMDEFQRTDEITVLSTFYYVTMSKLQKLLESQCLHLQKRHCNTCLYIRIVRIAAR